jgi:menaquinone-dependent protoporphyrinogen oxidase
MGRWLGEATRFVYVHRNTLASRPVWLFSSGPIGTEKVDREGRDVVAASEPLEFRTFGPMLRPRGQRVFFGAFDPNAPAVGLIERLGAPLLRMPSVRQSMPNGDFRDWPAIDEWANGIARELPARTPLTVGQPG